ncbi:PSD1 and planctomycete cytochrome C domain-containing protein [Isosphaeraceae bacterium EP7]
MSNQAFRPWSLVPSAKVLAFLLVATPAFAAEDADFFELKVRPLLVKRCLECHGDAGKPKGGLRLSSRELILAGGDGGPAAVSGNPSESMLVEVLKYVDEPRMPPKEKLPDDEVAILTRWVADGMPWPDSGTPAAAALVVAKGGMTPITDEQRRFWSFLPVVDPAPPAVRNAAWPVSDVDRFVLARLEAAGLTPALAADKPTLIRRATFDLHGLPPTPEEVAAFLADTSPGAFGRLVDRLLASPRYGQRWGRHWLDVVRYADSRDSRGVGGADDIGEAYRYRDWVVDAFNRDLPYDAFIVNQIAGDLLPSTTPGETNVDGLVATGLLTIGEWGTGDADKEKMLTDIVSDQIDVVSRGFLGLTIACARCHDHKFDPIPTADYYGLAGIFFSTRILPEPGAKTGGSPMLRTPIATKAQLAAAERYRARMAELTPQINAGRDAAFAAWAKGQLPATSSYVNAAWEFAQASPNGPANSLPVFAAARGISPVALGRWLACLGLVGPTKMLDQVVTNMGGMPGVHAWSAPGGIPWVGVNTKAEAASIATYTLPPRSVDLHPAPRNPAAIRWRSPIQATLSLRGKLADGDPAGGDGVAWSIGLGRSGVLRNLARGDVANGGSQPIDLKKVDVKEGDVIELSVGPKAEYTCDTTAVTLVIEAVEPGGKSTTWDLAADLLSDLHAGNPHSDGQGHVAVWSFVEVEAGGINAVRPLADDPVWASWDAATQSDDPAKIEEAADLIGRRVAESPAFAAAIASPAGPTWSDSLGDLPPTEREHLSKLEAERNSLATNPPPPIPLALAAQDGGVPKSVYEGINDARIQVRGDYRRLGESVPRHFPRIAAGDVPPPELTGSGRLELARWIARPENPLTARVMVNRIWQHHFGAGLVSTPGNFGKLGVPPTHPELLDHLASRFAAEGWSIKAMHRRIMLSKTYQQSTTSSGDGAKLDPANRLIGRMNRRRLESEALRDSLLAVSGKLDPSLGGPSIRDLNSFRRTLYLMTIRSDRSSYGPLFDAADSAAIIDTRTVSTVAPQALFLLNHPFVLARAHDLAARVMAEAQDDEARIGRLYSLLFGRPADSEERQAGLNLLADARKAGSDAEAESWAAYAHVLLCTNEFVLID